MKFLEETLPSHLRRQPLPGAFVEPIEKQIRQNEAAEYRKRIAALNRLTESRMPDTTIDGAEVRHFCAQNHLRPPEPISRVTIYRITPTTEICALWRSCPGLFHLAGAVEFHRLSPNAKPTIKPLIR